MALNLLNLKKAGARISNGGRIVEFDLIGTDGVPHQHGFALPEGLTETDEFSADTAGNADPAARDFRDDDPSTLAGTRALFAFSEFSRALGKAAKDRMLSPHGKLAAVNAAGVGALATLGIQFARLLQAEPAIEAQGAKLLAVPNADPSESAWDVEVYKHWRSIDPDKRTLFELGLQEKEAARLVLALKRTPAGLLTTEAQKAVASAWEGHIARKQPTEWAAYQSTRANHKWATEFVPYLARELRDPSAQAHGADAVPRLDAYKILRPLNATWLMRFPAPEVETFERVIAAEAARKSAAA